MKKLFKLSFAALFLSFSVVACNSNKKAMGTSDSTSTGSSTTMGVGSTTATDSSKAMTDTTKRDTTPKM